jgi:hypothetical protein
MPAPNPRAYFQTVRETRIPVLFGHCGRLCDNVRDRQARPMSFTIQRWNRTARAGRQLLSGWLAERNHADQRHQRMEIIRRQPFEEMVMNLRRNQRNVKYCISGYGPEAVATHPSRAQGCDPDEDGACCDDRGVDIT